MRAISTNDKTGIIGDEKDILRRKNIFGKNTKPAVELPRIIDSVKESLQDRILWGIMGAGAITLLFAPWLGGETFDWDGVW